MSKTISPKAALRTLLAKGACVGATAALALSMAPAGALAATYACGAGAKAADPILDELGMNCAEGTNPFVSYDDVATGLTAAAVRLDPSLNEHYIFATGKTAHDDESTLALLSWRSSTSAAVGTYPALTYVVSGGATYTAGGAGAVRHGVPAAGPAQAYNPSNADDAAFLVGVKPAVVIGNGNPNATSTSTADLAATSGGQAYTTSAVEFSTKTTAKMLATVDAAAAAALDRAGSADAFRYGDPTAISAKMADYFQKMVGYVADLEDTYDEDDNPLVDAPTVAVVTGYSPDTGKCTLATYDDSLEEAGGQASNNRYLEAVKDVTVNYADAAGTSVPVEDLYTDCDYVLVSGAAGAGAGSKHDDSTVAGGVRQELTGLGRGPEFEAKTFYASYVNAGALYGTLMNSVENLQNYGRLIPFLFQSQLGDDGFTVDAAMSYYVRAFYHVTEANAPAVMQALFGGPSEDDLTAAGEVEQYVAGYPGDPDGISYTDPSAFAGLLGLSTDFDQSQG